MNANIPSDRMILLLLDLSLNTEILGQFGFFTFDFVFREKNQKIRKGFEEEKICGMSLKTLSISLEAVQHMLENTG